MSQVAKLKNLKSASSRKRAIGIKMDPFNTKVNPGKVSSTGGSGLDGVGNSKPEQSADNSDDEYQSQFMKTQQEQIEKKLD